VYATITATNAYGESEASPAGNGATIVQVPDAPIQLADNVLLTSATVLALTWTDGISHGGKPIIDYKVEYD